MSYSKKTDWIGEMITANGLLYIEPVNPPSEEPVMDDLTLKMAEALQLSTQTGVFNHDGSFHEGYGSRGAHKCHCGVHSSNMDYRLSNGMVTNSLATHYVAWHRSEVPAEQLVQVAALPQAQEPIDVTLTNPPR